MYAFQVTKLGESPSLNRITAPKPASGQVCVDIKACGLNFADLLMLKGEYQETPKPPFTPGLEISGVVAAVGPNTTGFEIDTPVAVFGGSGGLAEYGVFPCDRVAPMPTEAAVRDFLRASEPDDAWRTAIGERR